MVCVKHWKINLNIFNSMFKFLYILNICKCNVMDLLIRLESLINHRGVSALEKFPLWDKLMAMFGFADWQPTSLGSSSISNRLVAIHLKKMDISICEIEIGTSKRNSPNLDFLIRKTHIKHRQLCLPVTPGVPRSKSWHSFYSWLLNPEMKYKTQFWLLSQTWCSARRRSFAQFPGRDSSRHRDCQQWERRVN